MRKIAIYTIFAGAIFLLSIQVVSDSDFGWHVRVGEYIVSNLSIPKTDLFSFTLPDYPYVYHSWASEVLLFLSYNLFGLYGTTALYAFVGTLSVLILYEANKLKFEKVSKPVYLFSSVFVLSIAGSRTRAFGFLFLTITYYLLEKYRRQNSKTIWFVPIIFLLWANFHGSFILGLVVLVLLSIFILISKHDIVRIRTLFVVIALSILATLINPFFEKAWTQAFLMLIFSYQTGLNPDWKSIFNQEYNSGYIIIAATGLLLLYLALLRKTSEPYIKALYLLFFSLSFISLRFAIGLILFLPTVANDVVIHISKKLGSLVLKNILFLIVIKTFLISVVILLGLQNLVELNLAYSSQENFGKIVLEKLNKFTSFCCWSSYSAEKYINSNLASKNILTHNIWASSLILNVPDVKVFYYGAMDNYYVDSESFAVEYLNLVNGLNDWQSKLEKYNVEVVYMPTNTPLVKHLIKSPEWKVVYDDDLSVIVVKSSAVNRDI